MSKEYPYYDEKEGRWYRWFSPNCKEFEPDIITRGIPAEKAEPEQQTPKKCPLRAHRPKCNAHCVLYSGGGCKVALVPADNDAAGKTCPFDSFQCNSSCAMFNRGCGLIGYLERSLNK